MTHYHLWSGIIGRSESGTPRKEDDPIDGWCELNSTGLSGTWNVNAGLYAAIPTGPDCSRNTKPAIWSSRIFWRRIVRLQPA